MKFARFGRRIVTTMVVIVLAACTVAPTLTGSWRDDTYAGKLHNVLVVGISGNQAARRLFESSMVDALKAQGVEATALFRVSPGDAIPDKVAIESAVKKNNYGSVITTRMIGKDTETRYVPGATYVPPPNYYYGMYNYVGTVYPIVRDPGYLVNDTIVSLESNGYDTATDKLVWSITTELFNPGDLQKEIQGLTKLIIEHLQGNGLI
jgi:hypothetical protein